MTKLELAKNLSKHNEGSLLRIVFGEIISSKDLVSIPLKLYNESEESKIGGIDIRDSEEGEFNYSVNVWDKVLHIPENNLSEKITKTDEITGKLVNFNWGEDLINFLHGMSKIQDVIRKISKKWHAYEETIRNKTDLFIEVNGKKYEWVLMDAMRLPYFFATIINNRAYALEEGRLKLLLVNKGDNPLVIERIPTRHFEFNFIRNGVAPQPIQESEYIELLYPAIDKIAIQHTIEKHLLIEN